MPPDVPARVRDAASRVAAGASARRRRRSILPLALGLCLSMLAVVVSACTTETITAVPPEAIEEPDSADTPSSDDASGADEDDSDDEDSDSEDDSDSDSDDEDDESDADEDDDDEESDEDDTDEDDDSDVDPPAPGTEVKGFPRGHMPPPGLCRVWEPGLAPGRQKTAPGDCSRLRNRVPEGFWLLYRPTEEPRVYRIG